MPIVKFPYHHIEASQNIFSVFSTQEVPSFSDLEENLQKELIQALSRNSLPESDQVLEIQEFSPLRLQIWNRDGSKASMCGNGGCALLYLAEKCGWLGEVKEGSRVSLFFSDRECEAFRQKEEASYELHLGRAIAKPLNYLVLEGEKIPYTAVELGNSHAVIYSGKGEGEWSLPEKFSLDSWGPKISANLQANISLLHERKENEFKAEFWELGAGRTKACGSAAIAIVKSFQELFPKEASTIENYKVEGEGGAMQVRRSHEKLLLTSPSSILGNDFFEMKLSE